MEAQNLHKKGYVYLIAAVATIGGLLFGYDTAVISGAKTCATMYL